MIEMTKSESTHTKKKEKRGGVVKKGSLLERHVERCQIRVEPQ